MKKRNAKTRFLIFLRKYGFICKKTKPKKLKIRVQSTVYPDDGISVIEAMVHNFLENKKIYKCEFDINTKFCEKCQCNLDMFLINHCINKKPCK
jgi:hypothetical protein